jgi:hypothetical protein
VWGSARTLRRDDADRDGDRRTTGGIFWRF